MNGKDLQIHSLSPSLTFGQIYTNNHYSYRIRKANPIKVSVANACYTSSNDYYPSSVGVPRGELKMLLLLPFS